MGYLLERSVNLLISILQSKVWLMPEDTPFTLDGNVTDSLQYSRLKKSFHDANVV